MKYIKFISFIWQNHVIRTLYVKMQKPVLNCMAWNERHVVITIILLLVIGMGLRIGYRGMVERLDRDEITYIANVEEFIATDGTGGQKQQFLLIYIGAALHSLGINIETGLRVFNLICSMMWLVMTYFLGKSVFDSTRAGLACLLLAVFNPYSIRISGQIMREPLYLLILSACLFGAIQVIRDNRILCYSIVLGVLPILGIMTRYEGAELLAVAPVAIVFRGVQLFCAGKLRQQYFWLIGSMTVYIVALTVALVLFWAIWPEYNRIFLDKFLWHYKDLAIN